MYMVTQKYGKGGRSSKLRGRFLPNLKVGWHQLNNKLEKQLALAAVSIFFGLDSLVVLSSLLESLGSDMNLLIQFMYFEVKI